MGVVQMVSPPTWKNSGDVCAYADGERHLGHVVRTGAGWTAFDATHISVCKTAYRALGFFRLLDTAKEVVEAETSRAR